VPIGAMGWYASGIPRLNRGLLLAGIAEALKLPTDGSEAELQRRIENEVFQRCKAGRVVVLDLVDVCMPVLTEEAEALVSLVKVIWKGVMERVGQGATFFLLSVAYPTGPSGNAEQERLARSAVEELRREERLLPHLWVKVLDELTPIGEQYVAGFLEDVLGLDSEDARRKALYMARGRDNEEIIRAMKTLIEDCQ
jgi:hypothetical protein